MKDLYLTELDCVSSYCWPGWPSSLVSEAQHVLDQIPNAVPYPLVYAFFNVFAAFVYENGNSNTL